MIRTSAPAQVPGSARSALGTPRKVASGPYIPPIRAMAPPWPSTRQVCPSTQDAGEGGGQPPVGPSEQLYHGRDQHHPHQGGVSIPPSGTLSGRGTEPGQETNFAVSGEPPG